MRITIIKSLKTNKNTKLVTFDYHDIYDYVDETVSQFLIDTKMKYGLLSLS